jgi:hypothetical protein
MTLSLLVLPNPAPPACRLPHLPLPNLLSSLLSLSLPPSPPAMAGCCVLGGRGWTPRALSLPLRSSLLSSLSPHPPQQRSVRPRSAREEEGVVAIASALTQRHCCVVERQASKQEDVFMVFIVHDLSKNSFFHREKLDNVYAFVCLNSICHAHFCPISGVTPLL